MAADLEIWLTWGVRRRAAALQMEYLNCNIPRALLDVKDKVGEGSSVGQSKDWPPTEGAEK